MTILALYRVPGEGAALACDSRVTGGDGEVLSDTCEKWQVCGSAVVMVAGHDGQLMQLLEPAKNWNDVRAIAVKHGTDRQSLSWLLLAYDRKRDRVMYLDSDGSELTLANFYATGAGGSFALGVLDSAPKATTLGTAARLVTKACKLTAKRNASCGGRIRTVVVHGKRGDIEVF